MTVTVTLEQMHPKRLAAVTRLVPMGGVGAAWKPALDLVWQFLPQHPGLHRNGHNIFVYSHPGRPNLPMTVNFGVEITRSFVGEGAVEEVFTPQGEAAVAVHRGPYDGMAQTHRAVQEWTVAQGRQRTGQSMEIYGDWSEDPAKLEVTILYWLR